MQRTTAFAEIFLYLNKTKLTVSQEDGKLARKQRRNEKHHNQIQADEFPSISFFTWYSAGSSYVHTIWSIYLHILEIIIGRILEIIVFEIYVVSTTKFYGYFLWTAYRSTIKHILFHPSKLILYNFNFIDLLN